MQTLPPASERKYEPLDEHDVCSKVISWLTSQQKNLEENPTNPYEISPSELLDNQQALEQRRHLNKRKEDRYTPYDLCTSHSKTQPPPREEYYAPPPQQWFYYLPPPPLPPPSHRPALPPISEVLPPISEILRLPPPPVPPICSINVVTYQAPEPQQAGPPGSPLSSPESPNSRSWFYDPLYYWELKDKVIREEEKRLAAEAEARFAAAAAYEAKILEGRIAIGPVFNGILMEENISMNPGTSGEVNMYMNSEKQVSLQRNVASPGGITPAIIAH